MGGCCHVFRERLNQPKPPAAASNRPQKHIWRRRSAFGAGGSVCPSSMRSAARTSVTSPPAPVHAGPRAHWPPWPLRPATGELDWASGMRDDAKIKKKPHTVAIFSLSLFFFFFVHQTQFLVCRENKGEVGQSGL